MKSLAISNLVRHFQQKERISRDELYNYFKDTEGELKKSTFGWRIYDLKKQNILRQIKQGWYSLNTKPVYVPFIGDVLEKMATIYIENYTDARFCVWDTNWINEFSVHQFNREEYLFETEKDLQESVAHTLSDNGFRNILWGLRGTHVSFVNSVNPIIVLPLISRAPLQQIQSEKGHEISVPTLEKMLVDVFDDNRIFHFVQGSEMERIFENAFNRYSINLTTFFAYGKRRGKEIELQEFLSRLFPDMLLNTTK